MVALLLLSSCCRVGICVLCLLLVVPWVACGLRSAVYVVMLTCPLIVFVRVTLLLIWTINLTQRYLLNRGSYISAHFLLNLLNKLRKRNKMRGLSSILSLFRNEFNKFNNTGARNVGFY